MKRIYIAACGEKGPGDHRAARRPICSSRGASSTPGRVALPDGDWHLPPLPSELIAPFAWTSQGVRRLRLLLGLTQPELGELLGISLRSVKRLEAKDELSRFECRAMDGLTYRLGRKAPAPDPLTCLLAEAEPFTPRDG